MQIFVERSLKTVLHISSSQKCGPCLTEFFSQMDTAHKTSGGSGGDLGIWCQALTFDTGDKGDVTRTS